eukprot:ANDGO_03312.mRNA.1 DNA mismatch repair protein MutS
MNSDFVTPRPKPAEALQIRRSYHNPSRTPATVGQSAKARTTPGSIRTATSAVSFSDATSKSKPLVICSALESKSNEVGLASFEVHSLTLTVYQFLDSPTRWNAVTVLNVADPSEIVLPSSVQGDASSKIWNSVQEAYPKSQIKSMPRKMFDSSVGYAILRDRVLAEDRNVVDVDLENRFLALSAACAVLRYAETCRNVVLLPKTIRFSFRSLDSFMVIDAPTSRSLELVQNMSDGSDRNTLFAVLNRSKTPMGARLIRTTILQPLRETGAIRGRLKAVAELVNRDDVHLRVQEALRSIPDFGFLCGQLAASAASAPKRWQHSDAMVSSNLNPFRSHLQNIISAIMQVHKGLRTLPDIADELSCCSDSPLLRSIGEMCNDDTLATLRANLDTILEEDVSLVGGKQSFGKGSLATQVSQIFAVKQGINPLLDIARQQYSDITEEILSLGDKYRVEYNIPSLKLSFSTQRGYFLQLSFSSRGKSAGNQREKRPRDASFSSASLSAAASSSTLGSPRGDDVDTDDDTVSSSYAASSSSSRISMSTLPNRSSIPGLSRNVFLQQVIHSNRMECTTEEVMSLNERLREILSEIIIITCSVLEETASDVRSKIPKLFELGDGLALLDMIASFAEVAKVSDMYSCPEMVDEIEAPLGLVRGRHPILDKLASGTVPNDTLMTFQQPLQLVVGANMAGKSVYVKQTALLVIMAHIGSFVPAAVASMRVFDRIFVRAGADDDILSNASTFMVEMREVANIMHAATSHSLVIMDELGRGTSHADGESIAWSVCEHLMSMNAFTLFVTHYAKIRQLAAVYSECKLLHLHTESIAEGSVSRLQHSYRVSDTGECAEDYGIQLAQHCGYPPAIVEVAKEFRRDLKQKGDKDQMHTMTMIETFKREAEERKHVHETGNVDFSRWSAAEIRSCLEEIQRAKHSNDIVHLQRILEESAKPRPRATFMEGSSIVDALTENPSQE